MQAFGVNEFVGIDLISRQAIGGRSLQETIRLAPMFKQPIQSLAELTVVAADLVQKAGQDTRVGIAHACEGGGIAFADRVDDDIARLLDDRADPLSRGSRHLL